MPLMYLELIENKVKILPDKVDTDHVSKKKGSPDAKSEVSSVAVDSDDGNIFLNFGDANEIDPMKLAAIGSPISESVATPPAAVVEEDTYSALKKALSDENGGSEKPPAVAAVPAVAVAAAPAVAVAAAVASPVVLGNPPTLTELAKRGEVKKTTTVHNLDYTKDGEDDRKREMLFQFELLSKSNGGSDMPEFNMFSDLTVMERALKNTKRRRRINKNVRKYKKGLTFAFAMMEFFGARLLKIDLKGFSKMQAECMDDEYESLLLELGERETTEDAMAPEWQLVLAIATNTGMFLAGKVIEQKFSSSVLGSMFGQMMGGKRGSSPVANSAAEMRRPDMSLFEKIKTPEESDGTK